MTTIKVKTNGKVPAVIEKGDWIDLYTSEEVRIDAPKVVKKLVGFSSLLIPLGIAMKLPEGYEAVLAPRSSAFSKYGIIMANSVGIIDGSYNGNDDEWKMPVVAMHETLIPKGTRIAQFRIQLSQKATVWQKIKWLFSGRISIERVKTLNEVSRGGFGSTGE